MKSNLIPARFVVKFEDNLLMHEYNHEDLKLCAFHLSEYLVNFSSTRDYALRSIDPYFRVSFCDLTVPNGKSWDRYTRTMLSGGRLVKSGFGENYEKIIGLIKDSYGLSYGTLRDKVIYDALSSDKIAIKDYNFVHKIGSEYVKFFTTGFFVYVLYPEYAVKKEIENGTF